MLVFVVSVAVAGGAFARAGVVRRKPGWLPPASQVALGGSFRPMRGVTGLRASSNYLLLGTTVSGDFLSTGWIVINNRLGTRTVLDPRCHVLGLGPPWVLMGCPLTSNPFGPFDVELYSLPDGTRQTVTPSTGVPYCSSSPPPMTGCASADAVGADWIRWDVACSVHCGDTYLFQNIRTGELRDDPTNARTFADLNSPALARRTCPGVRLIRYFDYGVGWGSLSPYGQFALATSGPDGGVFLERCGTSKRRLLLDGITAFSDAMASNARAIVSQAHPSHLSGLFLPSLQRFTIPLPAAILKPRGAPENTPVSALVLTSRALYVEDGYGTIWRTAAAPGAA